MRALWPILFVGLAACGFNPHPQSGALPCDKGCPSGYHCAIDRTCRTTDLGADASSPSDGRTGDTGVTSDAPSASGDVDGPAGTGGSGGVVSAGGLTGTGGIVGSGGIVGRDGSVGSGGVTASGGLTGSGGIKGSGGLSGLDAASGRGGVVVTGATDGTGGVVATGGVAGGSGVVGTGGIVGTGSVAPVRELDLVFMVDNSPSMAPKQDKMNAQFPKLIKALEDATDHKLPNLRVAIIDSDLGTGGAYDSGPCGPNPANGYSAYGDLGHFRMLNGKACGMNDDNQRWIEYAKGAPVNYDPTKDINNVFACLAKGLGTLGCGEESQLQAFEFALVAKGVGNDQQQSDFLRPTAYLGLVFLSDEDDCSAATNYGMFGDLGSLKWESASLRCATRAHRCNDQNLTDTPPGYPTTAAFTAPFAKCEARLDKNGQPLDSCPNATDGLPGTPGTDTSVPTACNPLKSVTRLAADIKSLKSSPNDQILVAGIFGWPLDDSNDPSTSMANATYKIDKIPNPNTQDILHPQVYDYWPVCYDPQHKPQDVNTYDPNAVGIGATGGLRMSAFIDQFGDNGLKFSICQTDFASSMQKIGEAIAKKLPP